MADRETKTITTPGGHTVVFKAYLTGREDNEVNSDMYAALKMNIEDAQSGKVNVTDVPGSFLVEQEQKALGFLLVSIDGESVAPVENLLELPSTEYDFIIKEV